MLLPLFRRPEPAMTGPEHPPVAAASLLPVSPGPAHVEAPAAPAPPPATPASGSRSPIAAELRIAESLDEFQALVRRHQVDRIYLDLLELSPAAGADAFCVILSASKGGTDILARLNWLPEKHRAATDAQTFRNVLRSRFLFLGYSVSDGLASARLARHLPPDDHTPAAKSA